MDKSQFCTFYVNVDGGEIGWKLFDEIKTGYLEDVGE